MSNPYWKEYDANIVRLILGGFPKPREMHILKYRFGVGCEPHTLRETADEYGLTPERIRQIEAKGLWKIRKSITFNRDLTSRIRR